MMDADHLAALNRGYRKRDFTGWHDCGYRGYALDCGGFSVVYDEGEYFVRVRNNRIDVCARIGHIRVEEREVVMILARNSRKKEIMEAINEHCGITTECHGVVFSVPIADIEGIG